MINRTILLFLACAIFVLMPLTNIHAEDISGTYVLERDSDGTKPKQAAVVTITFKGGKTGKVSMTAVQPGETVTDTGTYSINDDRITIRFKEMEWEAKKQQFGFQNGKLTLPFKALGGSAGPGTSTWAKQDSPSGGGGGKSANNSASDNTANNTSDEPTPNGPQNNPQNNKGAPEKKKDTGCQYICLTTKQYFDTTEECQDNCKIGLTNPINPGRSCIVPVCDLKAEHGPYKPVERAGTVKLDGSKSKGRDLKYEWTFRTKDCPDGVSGNSDAKKQGQKAEVKLLCTTDITLTVRSGNRTAQKTVTAAVNKRDWKTDFKFAGESFSTAVPFVPLVKPDGLQIGKNACTCSMDSGHYIHRKDNAVWEGDVYQMNQVNDAGGPFHGFWYVSSKNMKVERRSILNADLLPSSATYKVNAAAERKADFDLLLLQAKAHERMHATLLEEKLKESGFDPAKKIEEKFRKDKAELKEVVDHELGIAENLLDEATANPKVHERLRKQQQFNRKGQILVREGLTNDYDTWIIPSYADLGND